MPILEFKLCAIGGCQLGHYGNPIFTQHYDMVCLYGVKLCTQECHSPLNATMSISSKNARNVPKKA